MIHTLGPQHKPILQISAPIFDCHNHPSHSQQHISAVHRLRRGGHYILPINRMMVRTRGRQHRRLTSSYLQPGRRYWTNFKHSMICNKHKHLGNSTNIRLPPRQPSNPTTHRPNPSCHRKISPIRSPPLTPLSNRRSNTGLCPTTL